MIVKGGTYNPTSKAVLPSDIFAIVSFFGHRVPSDFASS